MTNGCISLGHLCPGVFRDLLVSHGEEQAAEGWPLWHGKEKRRSLPRPPPASHSVRKPQPESHTRVSALALGATGAGWCNVYLGHLYLAVRKGFPSQPQAPAPRTPRGAPVAKVSEDTSLTGGLQRARLWEKVRPAARASRPLSLSGRWLRTQQVRDGGDARASSCRAGHGSQGPSVTGRSVPCSFPGSTAAWC